MSLEWHGEEIAERIQQAAKRGLRNAAEVVLDEAVNRAPVETGALRASGKTATDGMEAAIGFGSGPTAQYSIVQHEKVGYHHNDGEAKYLENAVRAKQGDVVNIIADEIRGAL